MILKCKRQKARVARMNQQPVDPTTLSVSAHHQGSSCWPCWSPPWSPTSWTRTPWPRRRPPPAGCTTSPCGTWCASARSTPPPSRRWSGRRRSSRPAWSPPSGPTRPAVRPARPPDWPSPPCRPRPPSSWRPASSRRSGDGLLSLCVCVCVCVCMCVLFCWKMGVLFLAGVYFPYRLQASLVYLYIVQATFWPSLSLEVCFFD